MEQININTQPAQVVEEEVVEEQADGTIARKRIVTQQPAGTQVQVGEPGAGVVNVNVPATGNPNTGTTNININT